MLDINNNHSEVKIGSEKNFGIVFGFIFLILALYISISRNEIYTWLFAISAIFFLSAFLAPRLLTILNKLWFKFGLLLSYIFIPIVMAVIYFTVVTPTGMMLKLFGKDVLDKKINHETESYWKVRNSAPNSITNQF